MQNIIAAAKNLRKIYKSGTEALKGIDLSVKEGEVVGLIGPNGAGKTTLVKIFLGLLKPSSGVATVWNNEAYNLPRDLKKKIGFLLEEPGLYEKLTVEENLAFWAELYDVDKSNIEKVLKQWDLWDKRKNLFKELSAGMRQKLGIARALMHDPSFIIMDEPTSNLDPVARKNVVDILKDYAGTNKALLITSHDLFDIERICTRIVLIRKGRIMVEGNMEELKEKLGVKKQTKVKVSRELPADMLKELAGRFKVELSTDHELIVSNDESDTKKLVRYLVEHDIDVEGVEETKVTLEELYTTIVEEDEEL